MLYIGLTGNRYSGKNRISKLFKQIGIPVFDADTVLRFIMYHKPLILGEIPKSELDEFYFDSGLLNMKRAIKDGNFGELIKFYEEDIFKAYNRFNIKNKNSIYTIFKSSLLFELGWDKKMDSNINVFAPSNLRINRCRFNTDKDLSEFISYLRWKCVI
jgi:dephospho-CoA kinase